MMIPIAKPFLGQEEVKAAGDVILSGWVTQGPKVKEFEDVFAQYVSAQHACAVSNCTTALHLALLAVGVKCGDKVITVSHSFIATANAIRYCGATPVFVDIDPQTYNMDPEGLEEILRRGEARLAPTGRTNIKSRIAAILVVHQMGMPADLKSILAVAKKYKVPVIEDAACAIGSEISTNGKTWEKIGKPQGDIACFSFHPRKIITTGEGGMLTTNNAAYDKALRLLRHQGMNVSDLKRHQSSRIVHEAYPVVGFNYRLTDIQAAIGIEQLKRLPSIIARRQQLANTYRRELASINWLQLPYEPKYARSNWQSFAVKVLKSAPVKRDALMQHLLDHGIATRFGIMNSHEEKPYRGGKYALKNSEDARRSVMILPLFHTLTVDEVKRISELIRKA